jgi:transposase
MFERERYHRRVATKKPLLTEEHRKARLEWAEKYKDWRFDEWCCVVWTDEASFTTGGFGVVYVTRQAGEKYKPSCLVPKFRGFSSWMAHGCISGLSKGPLVVFEKDYGKVAAEVYTKHVLSGVYKEARELVAKGGSMWTIIMEDNASIHTANLTQASHKSIKINRMKWPANSPDLNPIENVWRLLKERIGKRFPRTDAEVRQFLEEEWNRLTLDDFVHYIKSMPEHVQAVIDANGGHTKW